MTDTENSEPSESETPKGKSSAARRWLRRCGWASALVAVVLLFCTIFGGSNAAFQAVWFPVGEKVTGAKIGAAQASFALTGKIELIDFRYEDAAIGVTAKIRRAEIEFSPKSLIIGERPRLTRVEIMGLRVVMNEAEEESEESEPIEIPETLFPVTIDELSVSEFSLESRADGIRIDVPKLTVANLAPGQDAKISLRSTSSYAPSDGNADSYVARINVDGTLAASEDGRSFAGEAEMDFDIEAMPRVDGGRIHHTGIRGPSRGAKGAMEGNVKIGLGTDSINFAGGVVAKKFVLSDPGSTEPSPELSFAMSGEGGFEPKEELITLTALEGGMGEAEIDFFQVTLRESITLRMKEKADDEVAGKRESDEGEKIVPQLHVAIGPVTLEDIRPWAEFAGMDDFGGAETGRFWANARVAVTPEGDSVRGLGEMKATELSFAITEGDPAVGPIEVDAEFSFFAEEFEVFALESFEMKAKLGEREFVVVNSTARFESEKESIWVDAKLRLEDPLVTAEAFGFYEEPRGYVAEGGSSEIGIKVEQASGKSPYIFRVDERSEPLRIENPEGRIHESAMVAKMTGQADAALTKVTDVGLAVTLLDDAGTTTGIFSATGYWPVSIDDAFATAAAQSVDTNARPVGLIEGKTERFDLRPWLEILGANAEGTEDEWPERSEFRIYPEGDEIVFEGEHRVGPILVPEKVQTQ